jgi:hypothetical protein
MSHPAFVTIQSISCVQTDDLTGTDSLFGVLGAQQFTIGDFSAGQTQDLNITQIVPDGITTLTLMERDLITSDDRLGDIDLTAEMDQDRVVGIFGDRARYDVRLNVHSEPD